MKILFINKYDISGGAAIAGQRLAKGLEKSHNTDNHFLVGIKDSDDKETFATRNRGLQNFVERGINFLFNMAGLQYVWFPFSTGNILKKTKEIKPDIISLHNLHGGYFRTSLLEELSKIAPLYWTLHDMWAFTANAAYTMGDESWKNLKSGINEKKLFPQIGIDTGSWLLNRKKRIYERSDLTIITPSEWLQRLASQSPVFTGKIIIHINNGLDTDVFYPLNTNEIRKELNIPVKAKVLVFGAENVAQNPYKGGEDLISILSELNNRISEKIHLIVMGRGSFREIEQENFILHRTGYLTDEKLIARYLSAADFMIFPTKADNLPNVLIEAIACGTPAITYDVGGCPEIIKDNFNGYIVPPGDTSLFADKIIGLLNDEEKRKTFSANSRKMVMENFSLESMADNYFEVFSKGIRK